MDEPTYFDLCSGIGMGSAAAEFTGFDIVGHCEIHPYAQAVLKKHWPYDDPDTRRSESGHKDGAQLYRPADCCESVVELGAPEGVTGRPGTREGCEARNDGRIIGNSGDGVGDPDILDGHDGRHATGVVLRERPGSAELRGGECGINGQSEPGLGGTLAGATWRLDRPLWPAGRGAEQFGYEPPRVAKSGAYRQERLMTLGNMVVPQQLLPIYEFIYRELTECRHETENR